MNRNKVACYVRVSTLDQDKGAQSQEKALTDYANNHNIENVRWYRDKISGKTLDRPAFNQLQEDIFKGEIDTVVCWKLDRLSRSMRDGINTLVDWCDRGVHVVAITQGLDFNGTVGKMIAAVLLAVAQMERENISENIRRGQAAARAAGRTWGGSKKGRRIKVTDQQLHCIAAMHERGEKVGAIAKTVSLHRSTIYRTLQHLDEGHITLDKTLGKQ